MKILQKLTNPTFLHGPFTSTIQARFLKPANTAQTRLETRTLDPNLDHLSHLHRRLSLSLSLYQTLISKKRGPFTSLNLLSRWAPHVGLKTLTAGDFLRKYPHVFEVFTHPIRKNACVKFTKKFVELVDSESEIVESNESFNLIKLRKIMSLSVNGRVHLHAIRLMGREFGLPVDFRDSVIRKYSDVFRMVDLEVVELVDWENEKFVAEVEKWRENEFREKWLSEFETKYAFPVDFPTGFRKVKGFKERLRNWQRLSYVKPYERIEKVRIRSCGSVERYEKRAVAVIHELLCLTVEKMVEVERLAHFRKDLGIEVNLREVLLRHPGIFYVSTRGSSGVVFLREGYCKGCLVGGDAVYDIRRKMMEMIRLGCRNTREMREDDKEVGGGDTEDEVVGREDEVVGGDNDDNGGATKYDDFVIRILEGRS